MIWILLVALFIFLGFAIHKLQWHFLISGYNMMSAEEKQYVNIDKLSRLMAGYCYFLAFIFSVIGLLSWYDLDQYTTPFIIVIVLSTIVIVIKAQKYHVHVPNNEQQIPSSKKTRAKLPLIITVVTLIGVSIMLYFSLQQTTITLVDDTLSFSGMYGEDIQRSSIEEIYLLDELPAIKARTNGSAVGAQLKGHFKLKDNTKVKLFVDKSKPPFIAIHTRDQQMIFNLDTADATHAMYEQLIQP